MRAVPFPVFIIDAGVYFVKYEPSDIIRNVRDLMAVSYTHLRAQSVHHMVKALGGEPLEEGVRIAAAAHTVDHLGTVQRCV